jgi:hypothetical protein
MVRTSYYVETMKRFLTDIGGIKKQAELEPTITIVTPDPTQFPLIHLHMVYIGTGKDK